MEVVKAHVPKHTFPRLEGTPVLPGTEAEPSARWPWFCTASLEEPCIRATVQFWAVGQRVGRQLKPVVTTLVANAGVVVSDQVSGFLFTHHWFSEMWLQPSFLLCHDTARHPRDSQCIFVQITERLGRMPREGDWHGRLLVGTLQALLGSRPPSLPSGALARTPSSAACDVAGRSP